MYDILKVLITVVVGTCGYLIAKKIKMPSPAMIGSLIAVAIYNVITGDAYIPREVKVFTQSIAGMFIGLSIDFEDLKEMKRMIKPIVLLLALYTINTLICGIIISYLANIDLVSAWLGCISGGVSDVSLIAIDMNANLSAVVFLQSARLICTLCFFPYWIKMLNNKFGTISEETTEIEHNDKKTYNTLYTIVIACFSGYVGSLFNFPASVLVFSLICVSIWNNFKKNLGAKKSIRYLAQVFSGALVGSTLTLDMIKQLKYLFLPVVILMVGYLSINFIFGLISKKYNFLDYKTALFSACPAGVSDMVLLAGDLGANIKDTGVIHISRLVYSIAVMPNLIFIIYKLIA